MNIYEILKSIDKEIEEDLNDLVPRTLRQYSRKKHNLKIDKLTKILKQKRINMNEYLQVTDYLNAITKIRPKDKIKTIQMELV